MSTAENQFAFQQQRTAKGQTILVKSESTQAHTGFAHIPAILLLPDFVFANNSTGIMCACSKIICNQLLITGHNRLKVGKNYYCMHAALPAGVTVLISPQKEQTGSTETSLAQSTGPGGQRKPHQFPAVTTQN